MGKSTDLGGVFAGFGLVVVVLEVVGLAAVGAEATLELFEGDRVFAGFELVLVVAEVVGEVVVLLVLDAGAEATPELFEEDDEVAWVGGAAGNRLLQVSGPTMPSAGKPAAF